MDRGDGMISAVMACLNEAHFLEKSLGPLAFCDEILVVDLGSQDESIVIAQKFGARVVHHEWVPFREIIIQTMLAQVQHDWVVMTDPDLIFPSGVGARLKKLIGECSPQGLGMIYIPMVTCFGGQPLTHGQKGGLRAYRGVIHRERVAFTDLLHHKGVHIKDGYNAVCLRPQSETDVIQHLWINNLRDAGKKAARYLPHEGRTRATQGQSFTWRHMLSELRHSFSIDLRRRAFGDWRAIQVMVFQLWYTWKANMALRAYERDQQQSIQHGKIEVK